MIKRDDNVEAYQVRYCAPSIGTGWWLSGVWRPQWDSGSGTWQKVGEGVEAVGSSRTCTRRIRTHTSSCFRIWLSVRTQY